MFSQSGNNQPLHKIEEGKTLAETFDVAQNICKDCTTSSPMVCVERCDLWRIKNEILEINRIVNEKGHGTRLLNAIKNARRRQILDALYEYPRSVRELQKYLKERKFYHSRSTIAFTYVRPLLEAGLVKEEGIKYRSTIYGRKIHSVLKHSGYGSSLPAHSCCFEETVLNELANGPRTFEELATKVPPKSLSRIQTRLRIRGLLTQSTHSDYVFYHRIKGRPKTALSPTEKRVFNSIPLSGIPARQLAKEVGITLRRTYKYLRRLREKKLVFALKTRRTYELTIKGKEIASLLDEIAKLATASLNRPVSMIQR